MVDDVTKKFVSNKDETVRMFENNILVKWSSPQSIEPLSGGKDSLTIDHSTYHLQKEK